MSIVLAFRVLFLGSVLAMFPVYSADAHIFYRDIQALDASPTTNPDGSTTYNAIGQLQSNGAWANGTDHDWGNSHDIPWYKFAVADPLGANVSLTVSGGVTQVGTLTVLGDLTPAFSLYSGLLPDQAHDDTPTLPTPVGKDGLWQALADTTMANDAEEVGTIQYLAHGGAVNSTSQQATLSMFLGPGLYTVAPGGSCYECFPHSERLDPASPFYDPNYASQITAIENNAAARRGLEVTLTVQPVPLPAAVWLFGSGVAGLAGLARRRMTT
ncbi:MAG: VPLPA-CTERM sorting domain-containing protein [Nitrospira sp.]|nr:VPLPA-CTERM sorting domain-containing protein [Nitrospira sp.]